MVFRVGDVREVFLDCREGVCWFEAGEGHCFSV